MSFFLHIPFPSWDIMRIFPWDDEILEGILGKAKKNKADYVFGFLVKILCLCCIWHCTIKVQVKGKIDTNKEINSKSK